MNHIALDLGGRKTQVCIRDEAGQIVREFACKTDEVVRRLPSGSGRVVLESCAEAFKIADGLVERGLSPVVVPSVLAPQLGVGHRGIKTDVRDAQMLSELSCRMATLPSVHIPSAQSRARKSLLGARESLVKARTGLVNSVRGYLRTQMIKVKASPITLSLQLRAVYQARGEAIPMFIEAQLTAIDSLTEQVNETTKEIKKIADADPLLMKLRTVTGVGPMTSMAFAAQLDRVERFPDASRVVSYLGLHPGERSSGARIQRLGISKAGAKLVRTYLIQASWCLWRTRPLDPNVVWAKAIAERRTTFKAIVALARKLARILYAMWRDDSSYGQPADR